MRCGRRWPHTTRCSAPRSRRTGDFCSAIPATAWLPRSRRLSPLSTPRSPRSGSGVAGADGVGDRGGGTAGRRLLRNGAEPCRTSDGCRPRWSDPSRRLNSWSAERNGHGQPGARRLRDIPSSVTVFQLQALGLRTDFPPLRALESGLGNLRPAVSSLVGRDAEVNEIKEALRARRLVTLTGVGGVGKTRLATEVAAKLADEFPDGVWVFELAAVS